MFDSVSAHIALKIKEKVWAGEYIDMSLMLKSGKDLVYDSQLNGELDEILPALDLTQSVHAKISIGMHRGVKLKKKSEYP
jgi:hypothetical protein